jgi:hypothetical protein
MTLKEIEELAGHRQVSPWVVKLVGDAVAKEREECANIVEENANKCGVDTVAWMLLASNADAIRARGENK